MRLSLMAKKRRRFPDHISANLINAELMVQTCKMYHALDHPIRIGLIQYLYEKGASSVSAIHCGLNIQQAVASQQLGVLRRAGLVEARRETPFIFYDLNRELLEKLFRGAEDMFWLEPAKERDMSLQY